MPRGEARSRCSTAGCGGGHGTSPCTSSSCCPRAHCPAPPGPRHNSQSRDSGLAPRPGLCGWSCSVTLGKRSGTEGGPTEGHAARAAAVRVGSPHWRLALYGRERFRRSGFRCLWSRPMLTPWRRRTEMFCSTRLASMPVERQRPLRRGWRPSSRPPDGLCCWAWN